MRTFAAFLGLLALGLAGIAVFAYPAWDLLTPQFDLRFHRLASRIAMLTVLVGFILIARRLSLADRRRLGYGLPARAFFQEAGLGLALGVVMLLPILAVMIALDMRNLKPGVVLDAATLGSLALKGITSGIAVALIEETFMRGAMQTGITRESGYRLAIGLTASLYSATHFLGKYRIPADQVNAGSGVEMVQNVLHAFTDPLGIADAFVCLAAVGVLLGMVRHLTGNIAACIGLHAGWVWVITFIRESSTRDETSPFAFLLSRFDGFVGWLVLAWTLVMGAALYRFYARRAAAGIGVTTPRPDA